MSKKCDIEKDTAIPEELELQEKAEILSHKPEQENIIEGEKKKVEQDAVMVERKEQLENVKTTSGINIRNESDK